MVKKNKIRDFLLWAMIVFFVFGGVLGASFFLVGEIGSIQSKILGTVFSLGFFSLLGMVSAGRLNKLGLQKGFAFVGLVSSAIAAVLIQFVIWNIFDLTSDIAKVISITTVISFSVAHSVLVFGKQKSSLTTFFMYGTLFLISVVSLMLIFVIVVEGDVEEVFWRFFGFFAILDIAGTIITPLMRKLRK